MNDLTYRDVADILKLLRDTPRCANVDLEFGGLKLSLRLPDAAAPEARVLPSAPAPQATAAPTAAIVPAASDSSITAPLLGTFYTTLEPNAPPCVKVGDLVEADHVVGLIEVMKLFTQVTAGRRGRIREVLVTSGTLVEHGQPLFLIDPV
jgi:acetyl-CoA carboxylase biotin carboxyl carrier protein